MGKAFQIGAATALLLSASAATAADFSYVGALPDPNAVQLFTFNVGSTSTVTLRTYSYAGGTNAAGQVISRGGFDPILALFDGDGFIVAENDDGGNNVPADINGRRYDTFLQALLGPGSYTVSVAAFSNFANGPNLANGFMGGGSFGDRTNQWAFDILNVNSAVQVGGSQVGAVPEPGTWAMMLLGFGAVGYSMRRRKRPALAAAV